MSHFLPFECYPLLSSNPLYLELQLLSIKLQQQKSKYKTLQRQADTNNAIISHDHNDRTTRQSLKKAREGYTNNHLPHVTPKKWPDNVIYSQHNVYDTMPNDVMKKICPSIISCTKIKRIPLSETNHPGIKKCSSCSRVVEQ